MCTVCRLINQSINDLICISNVCLFVCSHRLIAWIHNRSDSHALEWSTFSPPQKRQIHSLRAKNKNFLCLFFSLHHTYTTTTTTTWLSSIDSLYSFKVYLSISFITQWWWKHLFFQMQKRKKKFIKKWKLWNLIMLNKIIIVVVVVIIIMSSSFFFI